jgi:hypothetical protein
MTLFVTHDWERPELAVNDPFEMRSARRPGNFGGVDCRQAPESGRLSITQDVNVALLLDPLVCWSELAPKLDREDLVSSFKP